MAAPDRLEGGEARLLLVVGDDHRLLRLPDEPAGRFERGDVGADADVAGPLLRQDVQAHAAGGGVVQQQADEVEGDDAAQALGQVVQQFGQVAIAGDGLGDFEQGLALLQEKATARGIVTHATFVRPGRRPPIAGLTSPPACHAGTAKANAAPDGEACRVARAPLCNRR